MMKEVAYVKLVDLEPSPCNQIVVEDSAEDNTMLLECPHHIIVNVIKIVGDQIKQKKFNEEPLALQQTKDTQKLVKEQHQEMITIINTIKEEMNEIKLKVQHIPTNTI